MHAHPHPFAQRIPALLRHALVFCLLGSVIAGSSLRGAAASEAIPKRQFGSNRSAIPAFSPDGKTALFADYHADLYNVESGELEQQILGHFRWIRSAAFFPDGNQILTSSLDGTMRSWSSDTGQELWRMPSPVFEAVLSPDGSRLITYSSDRLVRAWDTETGQDLWTLALPESTSNVVISPDTTRLIALNREHHSTLWDLTNQEQIKELDLLAWDNAVNSPIVFSPNGSSIAIVPDFRTIQILDVETFEPITTIEAPATSDDSNFRFMDSLIKACKVKGT